VLSGAVPPAGRLPVSLPRHVGQVPVYAGHRAGGGTAMFYRRYADSETAPRFPFGHGLTFTTFERRLLTVEPGDTASTPTTVTAEVTNTGERVGVDVVQVYACDEVASVARPDRRLVGFASVTLAPGETRTVRFQVHPSRLAFYDPEMRFVCEPGAFRFLLGASVADVWAEQTVGLTGEVREHRQRDVVATSVVVAST
jgi:Fibronectin type III-like domain